MELLNNIFGNVLSDLILLGSGYLLSQLLKKIIFGDHNVLRMV